MAKPKLYQDIDNINTHLNTHDEQLADNTQHISENNQSALQNVHRKLANEEDVLIHCVGDSTTFGAQYASDDEHTYVAYLARLLAEKYPRYTVERYDGDYTDSNAAIDSWTKVTVQTGTNGKKIIITRNGIGGNTLLKIINRNQNYTGYFTQSSPWLYPDMIILLEGINDSLSSNAQRYMPADQWREGIKSFIHLIKKQHNKCDIALMSPNWGALGTLDSYADKMREVAFYEGVAFVDIHKLWLEHYDVNATNYGQGDWLSGDQWHPTDSGYEAIAYECYRVLFKDTIKSLKREYGQRETLYGLPINSGEVYTGTWVDHSVTYGNITYNEKTSNTASSIITVKFQGNKLYLVTRKSNASAVVHVKVDSLSGEYDLTLQRSNPTDRTIYSDPEQATYPYEKILLWENIPEGIHTLTLTVVSGWFTFAGIEAIRSVDNAYSIFSSDPLETINTTVVSVSAGTGTTKSVDVTFKKEHFSKPVISAITNGVNYIVGYDGAILTTTSVRLWLTKKDGTAFANESIQLHVISIG